MADAEDMRPDIPGSAAPPVEGARWFWIKLVAWGVAVGLILLAALVVTMLIGRGADSARSAFASASQAVTRALEDNRLEVVLAEPEPPESAIPVERQADAGSDGEMSLAPTWSRAPRPVFPVPALRAEIAEAAVLLECQGLASGRVGSCTILSEDPTGFGFGSAALDAMSDSRLLPREVDGRPVDATFRFTVRYRLG